MGKKVKIGSIVCEPGKIAKGWVEVAETSSYIVRFPVVIINGFDDGPTLGITSGTHPTEWAGIEANLRMVNLFKPQEISGMIISVPCVNTPGFEVRQYTTPQDGLNIATSCPGDPRGTMTERITNKLFEEVIPHLNYEIDLHGGGFHTLEVFKNGLIKVVDDAKVVESSRKLVKWFGCEYMFTAKSDLKGRRSIIDEAACRGIPSAVFEAGRSYMIQEEAVQFFINGTRNVMKGLKMLSGKVGSTGEPKAIPVQVALRTQRGGTYRAKVKVGEGCNKGKLLGIVTDLLGDVVEEVKAPADGIVYFMIHKMNVAAGDLLFSYGLWKGEPGPIKFEQGLVR
jgi:uncharacterized protein